MTTNPTLLAELADRIEKATGPDRELDAQIGRFGASGFLGYVPDEPQYGCQPYTASLDAAMTLMPEGWDWATGTGAFGGHAFVRRVISVRQPAEIAADAATPALALCAAALRAIASHKEKSRG